MEEELVIYLLVDKDLEMSIGKTAVQCARALEVLTMEETSHRNTYFKENSFSKRTLFHDSYYELYEEDSKHMVGNKIVTLGLHTKDMNKVLDKGSKFREKLDDLNLDYQINFYPVTDSGRNEVEKDTTTVIAVTPIKTKDNKPFKRFQVLR